MDPLSRTHDVSAGLARRPARFICAVSDGVVDLFELFMTFEEEPVSVPR